jgi:RNA polymerase sigma-54 factor
MVMESILKYQYDFFKKGIAYLKPMVLRDVAADINMHESTVSRVTTNKYAYTPQGIFELKYFFNSSIRRVHGDAIASTSVQDKIKKIIESEDPRKPYSDEKIAQLLKEVNINIARRTVAKYREMLGVLSSSKRKQF